MGRKRKLPVIQEIKEKTDFSKYVSGLDLEISNALDSVFSEIDNEMYRELESEDPKRIKNILDLIRPRTYDDCLDSGWGTKDTPCPFFLCKNNLFLEVNEDGEIKYVHKKKDFDQIQHTCLNRAIEDGPLDFKQISELIGVVRERARQIKNEAKEKIKQTTEFKKMEGLIFVNDENDFEECKKKPKLPAIELRDVQQKETATQTQNCDLVFRKQDNRNTFSVEKTKNPDTINDGAKKTGPTRNEWRKRRFYPGR